MVWVVLFLLLMGTIGFADRAHWRDPRPSKRPPVPVPRTLVSRLGPDLASWLEQTRGLHSAVEALHRFALEMLHEERTRRRYPRDLVRRVDDASFFSRIREVRELARHWRSAALRHHPLLTALPHPVQLPWEDLEPDLELPWGITVDHDRRIDRSDEIDLIARSTARLTRTLTAVDQTLSSSPSGYR
jgi:hypothetical protein